MWKDIVDFLHKYTPPHFSLVPDSGFPVGYGGRGSVKLTLRTKTPLYGSTSDLRGSMPAKISQALLEEILVDERDQYILDFLRSVSFDTAGSMFHIYDIRHNKGNSERKLCIDTFTDFLYD